jgi:2-dehydro-3-deoxyglucarate aldolase/4-hydroxy-2-oxoheptanedioate aldolase
MKNMFKKKLIQGELLVGTIITLPSPEIAEVLCLSGIDWLFVDLEHSALSIKDAQAILQAVEPAIPCLIRVPLNDEAWIKKALDTGASGIIVPQVQKVEDAKRIVEFCRYPPDGIRSVGIARAHDYGDNFQNYVESSNDDIVVIIQIEHINAVKNIEEIVRVPGVDCLFVGPYDLSASLNKTGLINCPEVQGAISKVQKVAEQNNIPIGIFGVTADAVTSHIQSGFSLIALGIDVMIMGKAIKETLSAVKK